MLPPSTPAEKISSEEIDREKMLSREADLHAIKTGQKTPQQINEENMPFRLSGERIDYSSSTSPLW